MRVTSEVTGIMTLGCVAQGSSQENIYPSPHGSDAWLLGKRLVMDGEQPDQEIEGMRQAVQALLNRVGELERMTTRGSARERELSTRVEELTRALACKGNLRGQSDHGNEASG